MNIVEGNKFENLKVKGVVNLKLINKHTNEVIDEYKFENTETILAQVFAGYFYGQSQLLFIFDDLKQYYPQPYSIEHIKKTLNLDGVAKEEVNLTKSQPSSTHYSFSFTYSPSVGSRIIYAISLVFKNVLQYAVGSNKDYVPFTILLLPSPIEVNSDVAITGVYDIYLDKAPYTFSRQITNYHYENTNVLFDQAEPDPDYLDWYYKNRLFIHPSGTDYWYGVGTEPVQSTGSVQVELNPDFINYFYNKFSNLGSGVEIKREIYKSIKIGILRMWWNYGGTGFYKANSYSTLENILRLRVIFDNTSDSTSLQYKVRYIYDSSNYGLSIYVNFNPEVQKYLYGVDNSLMVIPKDKDYLNTVQHFQEELFFMAIYNYLPNYNYISKYKVPFSIYKDCVWINNYPIEYYGDKQNDKKFVLVRYVDSNNIRIYKPDGTYDAYNNTNYTTSNPNINLYLLTFNEASTILDNVGRDGNWYLGIYITPDDWIHLNAIDEFKGCNRIVLKSGDYYDGTGIYKTLPSNTNGYWYNPFTREIINLDDNTVLETTAYINDLHRIFRKDFQDIYIVDLPTYNKNNLTPHVSVYHVFQTDEAYYYSQDRGIRYNQNGIEKYITSGSSLLYFPKHIFNRLFKITFIDNISPSFVKDEYIAFAIGKNVMPIDILQKMDFNVFRNVPFKEYKLEKTDVRLPKEYWFAEFNYYNHYYIPSYMEYETRNDVTIDEPKIKYSNKIVNYNSFWTYINTSSYYGDDHPQPCSDFSQAERADYIIKCRIQYKSQYYSPYYYDHYQYLIYGEFWYKDLDIDLDEYILNNNIVFTFMVDGKVFIPITQILNHNQDDKILSFAMIYARHDAYVGIENDFYIYLYDNNNNYPLFSTTVRYIDGNSTYGSTFWNSNPLIITPTEIITLRNI